MTVIEIPDEQAAAFMAKAAAEGFPLEAWVQRPSGIRQAFLEHAELWWQETRLLSSIQAKIFNVHYQRIIGMGKPVLPFVFSFLRDRGGQWYWALECITGENPAAKADSLQDAKRIWLAYATEHKYL